MARVLSAAAVNEYTERQQLRLRALKERVVRCETDPDAELRKRLHECPVCFYLTSGMAGQSFTKYTCALCDETNTHPDTGVPKICARCAKEQDLCCRCLGTVTGKLRRAHKGQRT